MSDQHFASWADMNTIRDWINVKAYGVESLARSKLKLVFGSALFVTIIKFTLELHETLLMQFVLGAILLHLSEASLLKFWPRKSVDLTRFKEALLANESPFKEQDLRPANFGLVAGIFDLQAERGKDFPLQQNALLIICLFWLNPRPLQKPADILLLFCAFFALKTFEQSKNSSEKWRQASSALREILVQSGRA